MEREQLLQTAQRRAEDFLQNSRDFLLGDIEAEQPHPLTVNMSEVFASSVEDGCALLAACDAALAPKLAATLQGDAYARFEDAVYQTLSVGGRIILSGCGSSGRLCMRLEKSFRKAAEACRFPADRVIALMTGGDYAVIRAVECFEDFSSLGGHQAGELCLGEKDLLIGVTATGETTSVLGSAARALDDGTSVWMVVCSEPDSFYDRLPRAATVYRRPKSDTLYLPCGPMALTGSTRMQSSTYEQAVIGIALDRALARLTGDKALPPEAYARGFETVTQQMCASDCLRELARQVTLEENAYHSHGLITYFADDFLLDVLTDTTERSPTFMTPPFVSRSMTGQTPSWAFVKNPALPTEAAWEDCFGRLPRCIEWDRQVFISLGMEEDFAARIPPIGFKALCDFEIGCEPMPERASGGTAVWIGAENPPESFLAQAANYRAAASFTLAQCGVCPMGTSMDLLEHLAMKMLLNNFSTGTMVRMGRVSGNRMTFLNISNKKLVDRSARIISLLAEIPYEQALTELFLTEEMLNLAGDREHSSTQETLRRLKK